MEPSGRRSAIGDLGPYSHCRCTRDVHAEPENHLVYRRCDNVGNCQGNSIGELGHLDSWHLGYFVQYSIGCREFGLSNRREHRSGWHSYDSYKWFDLGARSAGGWWVPPDLLLPVGALHPFADGQVPVHGEEGIERL